MADNADHRACKQLQAPGDPFGVICHPYSSEIQVVYEDMQFAPITAGYARTFAAALVAAADRLARKT